MNEFLLVSLGQRPEQPIEWLLWNPDESRCVDSGRLANADELPQLAQRAQSHPCYALLPQEQVLLSEVQLPNASRAALGAIPFQLEEQLCDDPSLLHFAVGKARAENRYPVAVVARTLIEDWRERLLSAAIPLRAIFADAQSLQADPERATAIPLGERLLVTGGGLAGLALARQALDSWKPLLEQRGPLDVLPERSDSPLTPLAARLSAEHAINLLQGEYRMQDPRQAFLRQWRMPALLALVLLVLSFAALGIGNYRLSKQKEALDQRIVELFRETWPEVRRIVNPRAQMEQKLEDLRRLHQGSLFLRLLEKSVPALQQHAAIRLTGLHYAQQEQALELELESADARAFERLAGALQQHGLQASPGQIRAGQPKSIAQMTIQEGE